MYVATRETETGSEEGRSSVELRSAFEGGVVVRV